MYACCGERALTSLPNCAVSGVLVGGWLASSARACMCAFVCAWVPCRRLCQVTIKVTMKVDTNGIMSVYAKVDQTGQELDITVTSNKGRMSDQLLEVFCPRFGLVFLSVCMSSCRISSPLCLRASNLYFHTSKRRPLSWGGAALSLTQN